MALDVKQLHTHSIVPHLITLLGSGCPCIQTMDNQQARKHLHVHTASCSNRGKAGLSQPLNSQEKKGAFPNCSIHADRPQMTSTNCKDKSKLLLEVEDRSKRDTQVKEEFISWKGEKVSTEQHIPCCQAHQHWKGICSRAATQRHLSHNYK